MPPAGDDPDIDRDSADSEEEPRPDDDAFEVPDVEPATEGKDEEGSETAGAEGDLAERGHDERIERGPEADPVERRSRERPDRGVADWFRWFLETDHSGMTFLREFLGSMLAVVLVGLLLFAVSGVWPPMVAVKSDSMEPHMHRGDLVFVMEEHRLVPPAAVEGTGIVTYRSGRDAGYTRFKEYGDVIIYQPNGDNGIPIIHRARFWVDDGENWYDEADPRYRGTWNGCGEMPNCPAPHAGFITKGDGNGEYDQVSGISTVVRPKWIKGTAEVRIPWLGHVRLQFSALRSPLPV